MRLSLRKILVSAALALAGLSQAAAASPPQARVFLAGDSTVASYGPDRFPSAGWGQALHCAFGPGVTVLNFARGGASTRSFIAMGRFKQIADAIGPGDVLMVQFGHNDARADYPDLYAEAETTYRVNIEAFVAMARSKGAQPILLTPLAFRIFEDGKVADNHVPYASVVRAVAHEQHVPLIDLGADSAAWLERLGDPASKRFFQGYGAGDEVKAPTGAPDDTHLNELGARAVSDLIAVRLSQLDLPIARRVKTDRPALQRLRPTGGLECE